MIAKHNPPHSFLPRRNEPHSLVSEGEVVDPQVLQLKDGATYTDGIGRIYTVALKFPGHEYPFQAIDSEHAPRFTADGKYAPCAVGALPPQGGFSRDFDLVSEVLDLQLKDGGTYIDGLGRIHKVALKFPGTQYPFQTLNPVSAVNRYMADGKYVADSERAPGMAIHNLVREVPEGSVMQHWVVTAQEPGGQPMVELIMALTVKEAFSGHSLVGQAKTLTVVEHVHNNHLANWYADVPETGGKACAQKLENSDFKLVV